MMGGMRNEIQKHWFIREGIVGRKVGRGGGAHPGQKGVP